MEDEDLGVAYGLDNPEVDVRLRLKMHALGLPRGSMEARKRRADEAEAEKEKDRSGEIERRIAVLEDMEAARAFNEEFPPGEKVFGGGIDSGMLDQVFSYTTDTDTDTWRPPGTPISDGDVTYPDCTEKPDRWSVAWGVDFNFRFKQTAARAGVITNLQKLIWYKGIGKDADDISGFDGTIPASDLVGVATTSFWVEFERDGETFSWTKATTGFPDGDDDTEVWPIVEITHTAAAITDYTQHQCGDIHITLFA